MALFSKKKLTESFSYVKNNVMIKKNESKTEAVPIDY